MTPTIAIVGRPNVGKSSLFNRLLGQRRNIVHGRPGTSRDQVWVDTMLGQCQCRLVDTGGWSPGRQQDTSVAASCKQTELACREAALILCVCDAQDGVVPGDVEMVDWLRRQGLPVLLIVNKVDAIEHVINTAEFAELGVGDPIAVSALHGLGIHNLLAEVESRVTNVETQEASDVSSDLESPLRLAFVGRPNGGKSSLLNAVLGVDRVIVHHEPGTTRDPVEAQWNWNDREYLLVDTAGLKRRYPDQVEYFASVRSQQMIDRSEVCVVVLDVSQPLGRIDRQIVGEVVEADRGLVIVTNKRDLVPGTTDEEIRSAVQALLPFVMDVPVVVSSAVKRIGVEKFLQRAWDVGHAFRSVVQTSQLNEIIRKMPLPAGIRVLYATQTSRAPATFTMFIRGTRHIAPHQETTFIRTLRKALGWEGVPIRVRWRRKSSRRR